MGGKNHNRRRWLGKKLARVIFLIIYLKVGFWRRGGAFKVTEESVRGRRYANESGVFRGKKAI